MPQSESAFARQLRRQLRYESERQFRKAAQEAFHQPTGPFATVALIVLGAVVALNVVPQLLETTRSR